MTLKTPPPAAVPAAVDPPALDARTLAALALVALLVVALGWRVALTLLGYGVAASLLARLAALVS